MKVFIADPEVSGGITESLTVAGPATVEELFILAIILLDEYPTFTAHRSLSRI